MDNKHIYFAKNDSQKMFEAFANAQNTFKYFWRELYWDRRRIVSALESAYVKIAFTQTLERNSEPLIEHMWINDVDFDGDRIMGRLLNTPNELTNIKKGNAVTVPSSQLSDWLFSIAGKTYGGFTIQAIRSDMNVRERREHDQAWGLNFGSYTDILVAYEQKEKPENLIEHPMSVNMRNKLKEFLEQNPAELSNVDEYGLTLVHREAIAGNKSSLEVISMIGGDIHQKTHDGKTALHFAKQMSWDHIIPMLNN